MNQKSAAKLPAKAAIVVKRSASLDVPALLALLADRFGVRPFDVVAFPPALSALREAGLAPSEIGEATVAQAGGLWRAGIADTFRRVDELNAAALRRMGDETRVAGGGDVRVLERPVEPTAARPRPPAERPRGNGLEILGAPAARLLRAMGRAGFSFPAARAALDELGGIGLKDATVRAQLKRGAAAEDSAPLGLTAGQAEELERFRSAEPEFRPKPVPVVPAIIPPPAGVGALD